MIVPMKGLIFGAAALGLFVVGCGNDDEGNDPPPAEGALSLVFQSIGTGGLSCNIPPHNVNIGFTNSMKNTELLRNNHDGADMSCTVVDKGAEFQAQGYMEQGATYLDFTVSHISSAASETQPALGKVSYRSVDTSVLYASPSDAQCEFFFENAQEVAAGRVWMQFTCPQIANVANASSCAISLGTIAMQNCEQ